MTDPEKAVAAGRRMTPRRRRPWLAALLSFFAPGAGQLYNGEVHAAAFWFVLFVLLDLGFFFALPYFHPDLLVLGMLIALALGSVVLPIAAAANGFIHARRAEPAPLAPYQRGWVYAAMLLMLPALNAAAAPPWIKSYRTPSASNVPTLLVGDRFLVEPGYYQDHAPQRGEMAVFNLPTDNRTAYVKRIVGLPGDTVQMRDGILYINGEAVPRQAIDDYLLRSEETAISMRQYIETLPGGASYRIVKIGDHGPLDNTPTYTIPAGHYFALGDNRDNSMDSRMMSQFGYIRAADLIGRAYVIYWPLGRLASLH